MQDYLLTTGSTESPAILILLSFNIANVSVLPEQTCVNAFAVSKPQQYFIHLVYLHTVASQQEILWPTQLK